MDIQPATTEKDLADVARLFREYVFSLGLNLDFQGFEEELATLPGSYSSPLGCLFLARVDGEIAGCIGLRPHTESEGEVKRLYLDPSFRGKGVARQLVSQVIEAASQIGYATLVLDTLASMKPAIALYESFGFERIPAYYHNPHPEAVYFRKILRPTP